MSYILDFRRYAPFASFGGGFHGDGAGGASFGGTYRTRGLVNFDFATGSVTVAGDSGVSYHVDAPSVKKTGKTSCALSNLHASPATIRFTVSTAGALPLIPLAPDIDTFIDFNATQTATGIAFSGTVRGDNFPNAVVFVYSAGATTPAPASVFHFTTTGSRNTGPMTRLAGAHGSQVLGSFTGLL